MEPEPDFPRPETDSSTAPHRRRPHYRGKNPRHFHEKYKELDASRDPATIEKVLASGKTPAGTHRPILLPEVLQVLDPRPGQVAVDCTLGYGGHAQAILAKIVPGGHLIGLDVDPIEQPRTGARLRELGYGPETFSWQRSNFAGLPGVLAARDVPGADIILADLGVSSMQIDNPQRGFSVKHDGPLDMRMNPERGVTAAAWLERIRPEALSDCLADYADEPRAAILAAALAGHQFTSTRALADAVAAATPSAAAREETVRRVFQAVRIAVNEEFSALDTFLRQLPFCLEPGGRIAVLTFHSGEDRRVKHAFRDGLREGIYSAAADEVIRAGPDERRSNPRSTSAKLRWARRATE